jgi:hypothetical protein
MRKMNWRQKNFKARLTRCGAYNLAYTVLRPELLSE